MLFLHPSAVILAASPLLSWPLASLPAIGLLGGFTGRSGRTPGKRLFRLRVVRQDGLAPGMSKAMAREAIRFLSLPILVLPVLYLATLAVRGRPPYDEFLGLQVRED